MKQINAYLKYDGGEVHPHTMYTGTKPFLFTGKVSFQVFGIAKFNGCTIKDTTIQAKTDQGEIILDGKSAIVFHKCPLVLKQQEENVPVPDIPDYSSDAEMSIMLMVEDALRKRGVLPAEGAEPDLDDNEYEDELDARIMPISPLTLLEDKHSDIHQDDEPNQTISSDSDIQQTDVVREPETDKMDTDVSDTGLRDSAPPVDDVVAK